MEPFGLNARLRTAEQLVHDGWTERDASAWAHHTADSATQIKQWKLAGYMPEQARAIYAITAKTEDDATDWRDLGLPPATILRYVEAGISLFEAERREATSDRPDDDTFALMGGLRATENKQAVDDFNGTLRRDSEIEDLDVDWMF